MRSVSGSADPARDDARAGSGPVERDRTARARIRDAAIRRFAQDGVDATSIRAIARDAGVSAALVMHHFGSKDALRVACDQQVAALIREAKTAAMAAGADLDPVAALRQYDDGPPLLGYLARTLTDGSPHVAELVDEMVADAVTYMDEGVRSGVLRPTDDGYGRAAVMTVWSLGALVLHEHLRRLLGADIAGEPSASLPYARAAMDVIGRGIMTDETYRRMRAAFEHTQEVGS